MSYYCRDCGKYFPEEELALHRDLGHLCVPREPIEKRLVYTSKGNVVVNVEGVNWFIEPFLVVFSDPYKMVERYKHPHLSTMSENKPIYLNAINAMSGSLENVAKHLSHNADVQTKEITAQKLRNLIIKAIKNGKFQDVSTDRLHKAKIFLCLDSSLRYERPNEKSKWICTTPRTLEKIRRTAEDIVATARSRARDMTMADV